MPCFEALEQNTWIKVFLQHRYKRELKYAYIHAHNIIYVYISPTTTSEIFAYTQAVCALSGAWIGAIVLPLDWDRDWQAWPISCVISTYVGHAVGVMAALVWSSVKALFGKKKSE